MGKLPFLLIIVLAMLGCGAGASESPSQKASAGSSADDAAVTAADHATATTAAESTTPAAARVLGKPAVDTSQLQDAPAWEVYALDGTALRSADLKGKVVLVDFWATWCGPCRRSIPHLKDLHAEYADKGLEVVGVSVDQAGPRVVKPFVDKFEINYPIVMGTQKMVQDFGGLRGIPTAFIISQDGKIYSKIIGLAPKEKYEESIKALLGLS
jgi:thiol-disulfide isomerase/thioredoxin